MITWATDYWYLCLIALIIGIITAAWIWLSGRASADARYEEIDEVVVAPVPQPPKEPPARLEPAKPVIEAAKPVTFTAPAPEPEPIPAAPVVAMSTAGAAAAGDGVARPNIPQATGAPDDLTLIKGVGPKLNALLISLGVLRFDQIAQWSAADIAEVDGYLGNFKGRITRDSWVEQADFLARNDVAGFEAKYGALGSENK